MKTVRMLAKCPFAGVPVKWRGWMLAGLLLVALGSRAAEAEVNVYSFRQPSLLKPFTRKFTETSGIRVNVVFADKGILERLKREGRNSPADMVIATDMGRLQDAANAGLFQAVESPVLRANIPAPFRHPGNLWFGLTLRARVLYVSRERVKVGAISSYEALTAPQWKKRICMRSSGHVYNISLMASLIHHLGQSGAETWAQGLKANLARKPQGNDRAQVRAVSQGECDVAIGNSYYMGLMLNNPKQVAWAKAVRMVFPNQDGRGAHVNISGAGITRSAPHQGDALRLLEFLSSAEAQRLFTEVNFEYPVKESVAWSPLLQSWGRLQADKAPLSEVAALREAAVRLFDRAGIP